MLPIPNSLTDNRIYCYASCPKYKVEAESRNLRKEGLEPARAFLLRQDPAWAHPGSQTALVPDVGEMRD